MAPKPASVAGRSLGGRSSTLSYHQQTAAPPANTQQQQHGSGTGPASTAGGSQTTGGVPSLLLAKGYDVLGIIGEACLEHSSAD